MLWPSPVPVGKVNYDVFVIEVIFTLYGHGHGHFLTSTMSIIIWPNVTLETDVIFLIKLIKYS